MWPCSASTATGCGPWGSLRWPCPSCSGCSPYSAAGRRPIMRRNLLALLLLVPLLTGCWNKSEIEEGAYVLAAGIDEGQTYPYAITVLIAKPNALAGKDGGGD